MRKFISITVSVLLILCSLFPIYAEDMEMPESHEVTVTVDESNILRCADRAILGMGTGADLTTGIFQQGTTNFKPEFSAAMENFYNVPMIRYVIRNVPLDEVGLLSERKASRQVWKNFFVTEDNEEKFNPTMFGPIEVMKLGYSRNPDCEFIFCISINNDPQEVIDFAHFLGDEASESELGARRAELGIEKPVKFIFELGNERDASPRVGWVYDELTTDQYCAYAKGIADAVKADMPECRLMACGKTAPWADLENWNKWDEKVAAAIGDKVDYISYHPYYHGNPITMMTQLATETLETYKTVTGRDDLQIIVTEHAKWPDDGAEGKSDDMRTLVADLSTSLFINDAYNRNLYYGMAYHTFMSGGKLWAMMDESSFEIMGMSKMYQLYMDKLGDRIVSITSEGNSKYTDVSDPNDKFSTLVSAAGDSDLHIVLTNMMADKPVNVKFVFNNSYTLEDETVFTAPDLYSGVKDAATRDIFEITDTKKNISGFSEYTCPEKSVVFLTLKGTKKIPAFGESGAETGGAEDVEYTEDLTKLSDISECWAAGEIMSLYDRGAVTGDGSGCFNPDRGISRAEFAAMLARALGMRTDYRIGVFDDVREGDWFYPYVSTLFASGFVNGSNGKFDPYSGIDFEQAVTVLARASGKDGSVQPAERCRVRFVNDDVSPWAEPYIALAAENRLIDKMYENGSLNSKMLITRQQAAYLIYRLCTAVGK